MEDKSFFNALLDLSFKSFITIRIIKVIYILLLVLIGIAYLGNIVIGFGRGFGMGLLAILLGALVAFLSVLAARVWMEIIIVLFRIAENTSELVRQGSMRQRQM